MSIQKSIKNSLLTMNGLVSFTVNSPTRYNDKQTQYFSPETKTFVQQYAKYSSDFVMAQVQGLDNSSPLAWQSRLIRMADVVTPTAAKKHYFDDHKIILFADRDIEYIKPGTKIVTMGSTWIAVNPINISGADGSGLVRRCNAVWNHLDFYGNVVSEPIIVENERANANDSDTQNSQYITKGYFNVICQYNDFTRQIDTNTRLILGTGAYRVTGYSDFETEFTGDYSTVRLLSFTIRYEEPNDAIDDMVNHVAGGKVFSWVINIDGNSTIPVGGNVQLLATSIRDGATLNRPYVMQQLLNTTDEWGEESSQIVAPSNYEVEQGNLTPLPMWDISYIWSSSDETVATVDELGIVTGVSEGTAIITATLAQNPSYFAQYTVTISQSTDGVRFSSTIPAKITPYTSVTITAAYYENGAETSNPIAFEFTGAESASYSASVSGNTATITSYGYSDTPLTVKASYGASSAVTQIELEGI